MDASEAGVVVPGAVAVAGGLVLTAIIGVLVIVLIRRRHLARRFTDLLADRALTEDVSGLGTWSRPLTAQASRWSPGMYRLFGLDPATFEPTHANITPLIHPDDLPALRRLADPAATDAKRPPPP